MNQQSEHLSSAQIEEYGGQGSGTGPETEEWVERHLADCPSCRSRVLESQRTRLALFADQNVNTVPTSDCPSAADLLNLAAGLCSDPIAQKLKSHANTCDHCGPLLCEYTEDFSDDFTPEEQTVLDQLNSASPTWQRQTARKMIRDAGVEADIGVATSPAGKLPSFSWKWLLVPATAAICIVSGFGYWYLNGRETPEKMEKLVVQAYPEKRTIELRLLGAEWGPPRVERAEDESQFSQPRSLQEATFRISEALGKHPNDPSLLRVKAEAELLTLDYKAAIATLEKAQRSSPNTPELLAALGIAYYESAEHGPSEYKQQEYAKALNSMSAALKQRPNNTSILFNRAILQEKLNFLNEAIADWDRFLQLEPDARWRDEAKKHLAEVRKKQAAASSGLSDDRSPPPDSPASTSGAAFPDPEITLQFVERNLLPFVIHSGNADPKFKNATALAVELESQHGDPFLQDILTLVGRLGYKQGTRWLAKASFENSEGNAEVAYADAESARKIFRRMGTEAGVSAALFEQAYSLQFQSKAAQCTVKAKESLGLAEKRQYYWLIIQSSNEAGICLNMVGQIDAAESFFNRAILLAHEHGFRSFYLRSLLQRSALKQSRGDAAGALTDSHAGLEEYFLGGTPSIRAYSFYDLITDIAEHSGLDYVKLASALEQASFLPTNPNQEVVASARFRVANIALAVGEPGLARQQFEEAYKVISSLPQTHSVRWRLLESTIGIARSQLADPNQKQKALATLQSFSEELSQINNRYLEQDYFTTLGEIKQAMGALQDADTAYKQAIALADSERMSAHSLRDALQWAHQNGRPYRMLTELLFDTQKPEQALRVWKTFHFGAFERKQLTSVPGHTIAQGYGIEKLKAPVNQHEAILTYALLSDGILVWVDGPQGRSAKKISITMDLFRTVAGRFMEECSQPTSSLIDLKTDAHLLYSWLIEPVETQLPLSGGLYVHPDGVLQILPWEALVDNSNSYLRERYTVQIALTGTVDYGQWKLTQLDKALIVGVPGVLGVDSEIEQAASALQHTMILKGPQATVKNLRREIGRYSVVHFAGHAWQQANGPALVLVDGLFSPEEATAGESSRYGSKPLGKLRLAVLSACGTAGPGYGTGSDTAMLVAEFLDSGAQTVVASRWNVDSTATAEFMTTFYHALGTPGKEVAEALRSAMANMTSDPQYSHPYYWAAFGQFTRS